MRHSESISVPVAASAGMGSPLCHLRPGHLSVQQNQMGGTVERLAEGWGRMLGVAAAARLPNHSGWRRCRTGGVEVALLGSSLSGIRVSRMGTTCGITRASVSRLERSNAGRSVGGGGGGKANQGGLGWWCRDGDKGTNRWVVGWSIPSAAACVSWRGRRVSDGNERCNAAPARGLWEPGREEGGRPFISLVDIGLFPTLRRACPLTRVNSTLQSNPSQPLPTPPPAPHVAAPANPLQPVIKAQTLTYTPLPPPSPPHRQPDSGLLATGGVAQNEPAIVDANRRA